MPYVPGDYDSVHLYVQWGGKLPGGESWSCGVRMQGPAATAVPDSATLLPLVVPNIQAFHTAINTQISARCLLSEVKVNAINVDGTYLSPVTNSQVVADVPGLGAASSSPANQSTMAVSLTTGFSRGPAHAGRFYVPMVTYPIGSDGLVAGVDASSMKTQTNGLITALNASGASVGAGWSLAVFSRKSGAATHRTITGCKIGRVMDTQRRRRRSLLELYV